MKLSGIAWDGWNKWSLRRHRELTLYMSLNGFTTTEGVKHPGSKLNYGRPEASEGTPGPKWTGPYPFGGEG